MCGSIYQVSGILLVFKNWSPLTQWTPPTPIPSHPAARVKCRSDRKCNLLKITSLSPTHLLSNSYVLGTVLTDANGPPPLAPKGSVCICWLAASFEQNLPQGPSVPSWASSSAHSGLNLFLVCLVKTLGGYGLQIYP